MLRILKSPKIAIGLGLSTLIGLSFGIVNGLIPYVRASLAPFVSVICVIPPMAILSHPNGA